MSATNPTAAGMRFVFSFDDGSAVDGGDVDAFAISHLDWRHRRTRGVRVPEVYVYRPSAVDEHQ